MCPLRVRLRLYIPPAHKWPIRNRKEPLLSSLGQRSVISSPPDTIETEPAGLQLHCSHPWCDESNGREVLNIWGHLGLLAKTTAVLRQFYFQLLSESPSPPVYRSPDPKDPHQTVLAAKPKTNAETMCWCKCMGVDLPDPRRCKKTRNILYS